MEKPNFRITQANFSEIQGSGLWLRNDISLTRLEECGGHFSKNPDTFALFASGCLPSPISDNGLQAIGGIDWVKIEPIPKNGEPDLICL